MSPSSTHRVAVTGAGAISAAGAGVRALWESALAARVTAQWMDDFGQGREVACCRAADPTSDAMPRSAFARLDRFAQLGVAAAEEAWSTAGLAPELIEPRRVGVIVGSSRGPAGREPHGASHSPERVRPTAAVYSTISSLAGSLSSIVNARGPSLTVSATCASSAAAIGIAAGQITAGLCDVVLVGGADAPLSPDLVAEMRAAGVVGYDDNPRLNCRPFDRQRSGILIGEAAAFLVLESEPSAERRQADIRGWLTGWSSVCDAGHRSGMSEQATGIREAMTSALAMAGRAPEKVDALHLHGTGTTMNDLSEAMVVRELFGRRGATIPCTSTKPITGHCLGASGALQAVINLCALGDQRLPPTANCHDLDPACGLHIVRESAYAGSIGTILTHSAGFWGNHAGLLIEKA